MAESRVRLDRSHGPTFLCGRSHGGNGDAAGATPALAVDRPPALLYKNPQCSCCEQYAKYLQAHGYEVTVKPSFDLLLIRRQNGVPEMLDGCHTTLIGG